jgi:hypothetical protein
MRSELLTMILHLSILSFAAVWSYRMGRWRWALAALAIPLLSWWWISDPVPRDGPDWVIVVMVALYTGGTFAAAGLACPRLREVRTQLAVTLLSGIGVMLASIILSFLIWALVDAL